MGVVYIYGLYDPLGELRYVGKTHQPLQVRLNKHIGEARRTKSRRHVYLWIRTLMRAGSLPTIKVIEITDQEHWEERERYWIKYHRSIGTRLCNHAAGGRGKPPRRNRTRTKTKQRRKR